MPACRLNDLRLPTCTSEKNGHSTHGYSTVCITSRRCQKMFTNGHRRAFTLPNRTPTGVNQADVAESEFVNGQAQLHAVYRHAADAVFNSAAILLAVDIGTEIFVIVSRLLPQQ